MATFNATSQAAGVSNFASGSFTSDNTATTVNLGFRPRHVKVFNATDVIVWEKFEGMGATITIKTVTAGTTTADTTTAIVLTATGFTMPTGTVGSAKALSWVAYG
jgi:hypothetical protein